jgi:hypothetical protein
VIQENVEKVAAFHDGINYHSLSLFYLLIYKLVYCLFNDYVLFFWGGGGGYPSMLTTGIWPPGIIMTWMSRC